MVDDVLTFWFGSADLWTRPTAALRQRWFGGGPAFDLEITTRFSHLCDTAVEGWPGDAGLLAAVLVLDQFPRNAFRGSRRAFAYDARARALALQALDAGRDQALGPVQRAFLYLPLEHAEDLALQDRCVACFAALAAAAPDDDPDQVKMMLPFAQKHRDLIQRFGRFPGRNQALGRADTPEEAAWLAAGGETFGQR